MTPGARLAASIELTDQIWGRRVPMDKTAGDYFRTRRHIGSKDRNEIAERVYSLMRHHARLTWWLERLHKNDTRTRVLLHALFVENMNVKRIKDLCSGRGYDPAPLTDEELALLQSLEGQPLHHFDMPEIVRVECPAHHEAWLRARFGDDFVKRMEEMLHPASLDLRVNTLKISREDAQESLRKDGVDTDLTSVSHVGLRVKGKAYLSNTKAFAKGWVEIQDEGSQAIALICNAKPGEQILDYCAGGGGKTLALAAMMENKGRVVAMDMEPQRLEKGRVRYRKAGVHNVELRPLSDEKQQKWIKRQKEKFDCVLIDVPCSSSGTWRRNPDLRWRQYGPTLDELLAVQAEILDKTAAYVKPGGRLVYATCSLNPAENEEQIGRFLAAHDDFHLTEHDQILYKLMFEKGFFARQLVKKG